MSVNVVGDGDLYYFKDGRWLSIEFEQVAATGGTETDITVGGIDYRLHTFSASDDLVVTAPGIVEAFLVGGGGAGGRMDAGIPGGGGGAGGVLQVSVRAVPGTYPVTVGSGGTGSDGSIRPTSGEDSSFFGYFAIGGAVGGRWRNAPEQAVNNRGASGGGGAASGGVPGVDGGLGIAGQGNEGGRSIDLSSASGGGGGAGEAGEDCGPGLNDGGKGGDGIESDFNGTATYYGGGGGGNRGAPPGGLGGGGTFTGSTSVSRGGTDGLGGGGAGARSATGTDVISGNGGNGLVMLRYRI